MSSDGTRSAAAPRRRRSWPRPRAGRCGMRKRGYGRASGLHRGSRSERGRRARSRSPSRRRAARPSRPGSRPGRSSSTWPTGCRCGLRGRAAHRGPGPHPRRAGEPHSGAVRRLHPRHPARQVQDQLPGREPAALDFTVSGKATGAGLAVQPPARAAVPGYSGYVNQNMAGLVTHTQAFCLAIKAGPDPGQAALPEGPRLLRADRAGRRDLGRPGHQHRRPVGEPGHGGVPVHRLPPDRAAPVGDNTLTGATAMCAGLVGHEQKLLTLVRKAKYSPLEMAGGATDLINEAATSKISGEEERYSSTDLVFEANMEAAMKVVALLQPYLRTRTPAWCPDPAAGRRGHRAAGAVPGPARLRRHRLRRVLHRDEASGGSCRHGERLRRGPVQDVRSGQQLKAGRARGGPRGGGPGLRRGPPATRASGRRRRGGGCWPGPGRRAGPVAGGGRVPPGGASRPGRAMPAGPAPVPFYGPHQAGIITPAQDRLAFGALNLAAGRPAATCGTCCGNGPGRRSG